jgi:hypothetical protein
VRGKKRRFTDERVPKRSTFARDITNQDKTRGNAHARLQCLSEDFDPELAHGSDYRKSRPHGHFGIVLLGARIAETRLNSLCQVLSDEAAMALDNLPDAPLIGGNDRVKVLGAEVHCKRLETGDIANQHRQLPELGVDRADRRW